MPKSPKCSINSKQVKVKPVNGLTLTGQPLEELAATLAPLPHFRAVQIMQWIAAGTSSFEAMSNLPLTLRDDLTRRFLLRPEITGRKIRLGADGTAKFALEFAGNACIEAVLLKHNSSNIRAAGSYTACLSTQAGCPAGCIFCKTGSLGFLRNLTAAEITEQFLQLRSYAEQSSEQPAEQSADCSVAKERANIAGLPVENIVIMGMGEPLLNLKELRRALEFICCPEGINFSKRRITVSTCGISEGIIDLADNGPAVRLAVSLPSADETLRRRLMPIAEKHSLAVLKKALLYFQDKGGGRITLETTLLGGINSHSIDAEKIAFFAEGLDTAINIIPWNKVQGLSFEGKKLVSPSKEEIACFSNALKKKGLNVTQRFRKGRSIMGACGQLGGLPHH